MNVDGRICFAAIILIAILIAVAMKIYPTITRIEKKLDQLSPPAQKVDEKEFDL